MRYGTQGRNTGSNEVWHSVGTLVAMRCDIQSGNTGSNEMWHSVGTLVAMRCGTLWEHW